MYEIVEHTADLGLRVQATDLDALFAEAGRAFFAVIAGDLEQIRPRDRSTLHVEGRQPDYLLVDWLSELLFAFDSQRLLLVEFEVSIGEDGLDATAQGEVYDPSRHRLEHEVKAVTYHGLKVEPNAEGWLAEVILDI